MPHLNPYIELGYGFATHIFDAGIFIGSEKENLLLWAVSLLSNYLISRGSQSFTRQTKPFSVEAISGKGLCLTGKYPMKVICAGNHSWPA